MFEAATFEVDLELALDIARQYSSLSRQVCLERGIVVFDKLIKEGTFRAMTYTDVLMPREAGCRERLPFVDRRANARTGIPASRQRHHIRILAKSYCRLA